MILIPKEYLHLNVFEIAKSAVGEKPNSKDYNAIQCLLKDKQVKEFYKTYNPTSAKLHDNDMIKYRILEILYSRYSISRKLQKAGAALIAPSIISLAVSAPLIALKVESLLDAITFYKL